jgi:WD40 repeat protein
VKTRHGTIVVTVTEPDVQVLVDGEEKVTIDSKKVGRVELAPGDHRLVVRRGGEELYTKEFSLRSGGEVVLEASWTAKPAAGAAEGADAGLLDRLKAADIRAEDRFEGQPPELVAVLGKPEGGPRCVAFSPTGDRLVVGTWHERRGVLSLWDVAAGKWRWHFDRAVGDLGAAAFAPDGHRFVTVGAHQEPALREADTGEEVRRFHGGGDCYGAAAYAPDGRTILTGDRLRHDQPGSLRWWDVNTGEQKANLTGHAYYVVAVAFFPDGRRAATGSHSKDFTARVWDLETGKELRRFEGAARGVSSLAVSPDGRLLAVGSGDGRLRVWDLGREGDKPWRELTVPAAPVVAVCFSADGKTLASVTNDFHILRHDLNSGDRLLERKVEGEVPAASFAADRRHLAVATTRGIYLFRLAPPPARQGP